MNTKKIEGTKIVIHYKKGKIFVKMINANFGWIYRVTGVKLEKDTLKISGSNGTQATITRDKKVLESYQEVINEINEDMNKEFEKYSENQKVEKNLKNEKN